MILKRIATLSLLILIVLVVIYFTLKNNTTHFNQEKQLLDDNLISQAMSLFDIMVLVRDWSLEHESIYVKNKNFKPNKYLSNNRVYTKNNEELVLVNPEWITRQISELANTKKGYFYKITSLQPINKDNSADEFETEALTYFENNINDKYYYKLPEDDTDEKYFNFMGSLKVTQDCLKCHQEQGYKVGDIRGGIRVSIPIVNYKNTLQTIKSHRSNNQNMIIIFSVISFIGASFTLFLFFRHQEKIKKLNLELTKKVDDRTKELSDLNENLETRVKEAVKENQEKEKMMIVQSKHAAMGEMLSMIAHQWRQPLSQINMSNNNIMLELLMEDTDLEAIKTSVEDSFAFVEHLSNTIDDFANFFKPTKKKEVFVVNELIDKSIFMTQDVFEKEGIKTVVYFNDKSKIKTYKRELLHVFLNILNNAKDAFETDIYRLNEKVVRVETYEEKDEIVIKFYDNAGGIDPEKIEKIFEPYFSTKSKNSSGLGLYMSYVIIENHVQGKISAYNFNNGACFEIRVPLPNEDRA